MLTFEKEGFLEIEDSQIEELFHTHTTITLDTPEAGSFDLKAVLCRHKVANSSLVHVAFYSRQLKRAFIFGLEPAGGVPATGSILKFLGTLGFQLEQVNLNLNPALRQVVLKDVSGLLPPAEALRQRSAKESMLADLESIVSKGPADSEEVKRAVHKLNAERRLEKQATSLREVLTHKVSGIENATKESSGLAKKIDELNAQLHQAVTLAEEERRQRDHADEIRLAVEKRLQDLENDLVAAETRISKGLKKISQQEKQLDKLKKQLSERADALEKANAEHAETTTANQQLQKELTHLRDELQNAMSRISVADHALSAAEKSSTVATQTAEKEISTLKQTNLSLEQQLKEIAAELEKVQANNNQLIKSTAADQKRIHELEKKLANSAPKLAGGTSDKSDTDLTQLREKHDQLEKSLEAANTTLQQEQTARKHAESELKQAKAAIHDLEQIVHKLKSADDRQANGEATHEIRELQAQLEREQFESNKLSNALDLAIKKTLALEAKLHVSDYQPAPQPVKVHADPPPPRKLLPHETRPAPKPGALFHPVWDLNGLPCQTPEQILDAWESVYNVQLALEGYPTQYCTAFVVVIKEGAQKRLYLLFDLKKDHHILICAPGKPARNEAGLKESVKDAQNYLKLSGFEIEKISSDNIASSLKKYFSSHSA